MARACGWSRKRRRSSLPVVGELDYGARNSSRAVENLDRVERFVTATSILLPDLDTARWYGRLRHALKVKRRPLPENDVWIAALARQHDLTLVSRDAHFREVDALKLEAWRVRQLDHDLPEVS